MERTPLQAPVAEVVLLEDRAHVYRRGQIELPAGAARLVIDAVAPVLVDKTLSVATGGRATVVSARVNRRAIVRARDGEGDLAELERQLDEVDRKLEALSRERAMVNGRADALDGLAKMTYADLSIDVAWGRSPTGDVADRLDQLRERERADRVRAAELAHEERELHATRERLAWRVNLATNPASDAHAAIIVDLELASPAAVELRVNYVVPCACWRPQHRARLIEDDGGARVELSTDACVWQSTGEDWTGVALALSTERASLGTEPPRLASDRLASTKRRDEVLVEAREQAVVDAGLGSARAADELPGIDDAGEPVSLRAEAPADVPSDGRPHRIPMTRFEAPAEVALVAYPELTPTVITKVTLNNGDAAPILAGPVELIRKSGPVGRTSVLYVAPEERFELGFGPEPELRVKRSIEEDKEKSRVLSSWSSQARTVKVALSNLGDEARRLEVTERVPVSEIEKVEIAVETAKTTRGATPDADGFVTWTVELPPYGTDQLQLRYTVKKHDDVVGL